MQSLSNNNQPPKQNAAWYAWLTSEWLPPTRNRFLAVALGLLLYVALFIPLHRLAGAPGSASLAVAVGVVPIGLAGWLFGRRAAFLVWSVVFAVIIVLRVVIGETEYLTNPLPTIVGAGLLLIVGLVVGGLSEQLARSTLLTQRVRREQEMLESEALERKRAEETLRAQNTYFTALNDTAVSLVGRLNLNELLSDILNRAGELVGTKNGYVFLLDPETNEMVMRVGVGAYQDFVGTKAQPGNALAGKVWQTGEAVAVDDYRNWSGRLADPSRNMLRAVVGVPLKRGSGADKDQVIGVIGLAHLEAEKRFGATEMDVLNRFAALAAIALDNARLYESAQRELTQRRAAEGKLAYERDLLQALMDNIPDLIFFKDIESRFVRSNAAHLKNLGAGSMDQVFGKTDLDFHADKPAHNFMEDEKHIIETGAPILNKIESNPAADGTRRFFSTSKVPWRNQEGEIIGTLGVAHDITDRVLAEQKLEAEVAERQRAEQFLDSIVENLPTMLFVKDAQDLRFVRWNKAAETITGRVGQAILGKNDYDFFPKDEADFFVAKDRETLNSGQVLDIPEEPIENASGEIRWLHTKKFPMLGADGKPAYLVGLAEDITERKRAEQEIRESREFLETLVTNIPLGIFVKDAQDLRIVRWNKANEAITGISADTVMGKNDYELFPREQAEFFVAKDRETIASETLLDIPEEPIQTADRGLRYLHTKKIPLHDSNGKPAFLLGISEDITERKRAEDALRENEYMLSKAQEIAHIGSWRWDRISGNVEWSNELYRILGIRLDQKPTPLNQLVEQIAHPQDRARVHELYADLERDQLPVPMEFRVLAGDGATRYLFSESEHIFNDQAEPIGMIGVVQDITERRHAEQELRESEERYRDLFENANDLIQSVAVDGKLLYVNKAWKDTLGYTDEEVAASRFLDIVHPDGRAEYFARIEAIMRGETQRDMNAQIMARDGRKVLLEGTVSPRVVDGRVVSTRGIFRDVTARRLAEERATFQNALLAAQYDVSPDGILVVGADDRVLSYNRRFLELWKIPSEAIAAGSAEALRQAVRENLVDVEDWLRRSGEIYMNQGKSSHDEIEFRDGRTLERYSAPMTAPDGAYLGRVWFFHDITETRRVEQDIRRVVQGTRAIFWRSEVQELQNPNEDALGYHWETSVSNPDAAMQHLPFNLQPGQVYEDALYHATVAEDQVTMNINSSKALREGAPGYTQEYRVVDANGVMHWMYEDARIRKLGSGRYEVVGVTTDITERKRAEEALQYERYLLESLMDNLPHYIYFKDTESRFTRINRSQAINLGLQQSAEAVNKSDFDFFDQDHARRAYEDEQEIIKSGEGIINKEELEVFPDGAKRWVSTTKLPLRRGAEIVGTFGLTVNITDRKRAEEELLLRNSAIEFSIDSITIVDVRQPDMPLVYVNPAFERVTGYSFDEVVGRNCRFLQGEDRAQPVLDDLRAAISEGKNATVILRNYKKDGTMFWNELQVSPVVDAAGVVTHFIGVQNDITARLEAQKALEQQNSYLNALQETSLGLMQRLDVNALLQDIVARAGALVGTENGYVFLRDADFQEMEMRVGVGAYEGFVGRRTKPGVGLAGEVWEKNAPVTVDDYRTFGGRLADASRDILRAVVGVPLRSGNEVIGVIGLAYLDETRKFGPAEIQVLQRFAQLATIALDNARLYETAQLELTERSRAEAALAEQLRETELLNRVTNHAVNLDVDTALVEICRDLAEYFGVEQSGIALLNEDQKSLTVVAEYSPVDSPKVVGYVIPVQGNPSTEIVLETRQAVAFSHARTDPRLASIQDLMQTRGTASLMIAPLFVRDEIIGTLGVDSHTPREFSEADVSLVQRVAVSISTALENARLYRAAQQELTERRRAEQEIRQRNRELEVISRVSAVMTTNIDMKTALETLARELVQTFNARNCGIALLDPSKTSLTVVADALAEEHEEHAVGIVIPLDGNLSSQYVVDNKRSLVIPDAQTDPMTEPIHERMRQRRTKCLAIIPLLSGGDVIGTIGLDTTDPDHIFTDEEIRLAETMANQMANAIEKQRLFDQTKARARREQLTREIGANLTRSLDLEQILQTTARQLSHALGASHAVVRMGATQEQDGGNGHT